PAPEEVAAEAVELMPCPRDIAETPECEGRTGGELVVRPRRCKHEPEERRAEEACEEEQRQRAYRERESTPPIHMTYRRGTRRAAAPGAGQALWSPSRAR